MAVIWVSEVCAICGGTILDGEKVVLISVVKATTRTSRDSSYNQSTYPGQIRINFIPFTNSERKLKHLKCSDDFKEVTDGEV